MVIFNVFSKFLIKLVLAKLLLPKDFGIITICFLIIPFVEILSDFGFSSVIIQKKYKKEVKLLSTIFWFNCILGIALFLIVNLFASQFLANYYNEPTVRDYIFVISFSILYNPLILIKKAFQQSGLNFKFIFNVNLISIIISSLIAIYLAFNNYGIWSLVFQYLISTSITFSLYFIFVKWRALLYFNFKKLLLVINKSSFDLLTKIVGFFEKHAQVIMISIFLPIDEIGYFNFATLFTLSILKPFNEAIKKVFFPFFSKINNNPERIRANHINQIKYSLLIFIPFSSFLFFYSEDFLNLFFGDKWTGSILILKYLSVFILFKCFTGTPNVIIKSLGHFNHFFYLQLSRTCIMIASLWIGLNIGALQGMLISMLCAQLIINIFDFVFIKNKINLKFNELIIELYPVLIFLTIFVCISFFSSSFFTKNLYLGATLSLISYLFIVKSIYKNSKTKNDFT